MSNSSDLVKNIVIVTTFDNEEYILNNKTLQQWNDMVEKLTKDWKKKVYLLNYDCNLYFSQIKKEKWKTLYLSLPTPKELKKLYTEEEREESRKRNQQILKKIYPNIKKNFILKRDEILKKLAFEEKKFNLETTIEKLEKLKKIEIKNKILEIKN